METVVLNLTDFLLARIAEDEVAAENARQLQDYMPAGAWDLDRVLAECEAKRRIVDLHDEAEAASGYPDSTPYDDWLGEKVFKALALPYADHPDYREVWKP